MKPAEEKTTRQPEPVSVDSDTSISENSEAIAEARTLIINLNGALKSYTIYPKNHSISIGYVNRLLTGMKTFLGRYGVLRVFVDHGHLFYKGEQIHHDEEGETNIAFLLSRDGVKWIEFHEGVTKDEIESFIELINDYRVITPVSDGDIVTALWEYDFPHIKYEAIDLVLKNGPPLDLTKYQAVDLEELEDGKETDDFQDPEDRQGESGSATSMDGAKPFPLMAAGKDLWKLTEAEEQYLKRLVEEEESQDHTGSVSEVLMLTLMMQQNEQDFVKSLQFLEDRLIYSFRMGKYKASYTILYNISRLRGVLASKRQWTLPHLDSFIETISKSRCYSAIPRFLNEEWEKEEVNNLKYLWPVLRQLKPRILRILAPLIAKIDQEKYRQPFLKTVVFHIEKNVPMFSKLLSTFDEQMIISFLPVIGMLKQEAFVALMLQLTKHDSNVIRNKASRKLLAKEPTAIKSMFPLLDDPYEPIRKRVLMYMGRKRDAKLERFLLNYFHRSSVKQHDPEHLLGCYEALGQCGSVESIPFLKRILFETNFRNMVQKNTVVHKKGAALSLAALQLPEAKRLLKKGKKSFLPSIRNSCKTALEA